MTDKNNETEHNAEVKDEEMTMQDSSQNEEWQDDLPPDDFHDQEPLSDDVGDDIVSEDGELDEGDEAAAQAERAKRGKGVLFGILVVGVVVIGGLAYLQFGLSSGPTDGGPVPIASIMNVTALRDAAKNTQPIEPQQAGEAAVTTKTGSVDLDKMYDAAQSASSKTALPNKDTIDPAADKNMMGNSTEILTSSSEPTVPVPMPAKPVDTKTVKAEPAPMPAAPSVLDAMKPVPVALGAMEPPAAAAKPSVATGSIAPDIEARMKDLTAQIDTLRKSLDASTAQNATLLSRIETLQRQKAAEKAPLADLAPVVIDNKKAAPVAAKAEKVAEKPAKDVPEINTLLESTLEQPAAAPVVKKAKPETKTVSRKVAKASKTASSGKKTATAAHAVDHGAQWVLRAATPDAAWVSISRDSLELRRVSVGESLPGLGKVKEIRQNGDAWQVVGETGVLK